MDPRLATVRATVLGALGMGGGGGQVLEPERPERLASLLSACIQDGNHVNAAKLQTIGFTLDATIAALVRELQNVFEKENGVAACYLMTAGLQRQGCLLHARFFVALFRFRSRASKR